MDRLKEIKRNVAEYEPRGVKKPQMACPEAAKCNVGDCPHREAHDYTPECLNWCDDANGRQSRQCVSIADAAERMADDIEKYEEAIIAMCKRCSKDRLPIDCHSPGPSGDCPLVGLLPRRD